MYDDYSFILSLIFLEICSNGIKLGGYETLHQGYTETKERCSLHQYREESLGVLDIKIENTKWQWN